MFHYLYPKHSIISFIALISFVSLGSAIYFPNVYPRIGVNIELPEIINKPLIITPYLNKGQIPLAQNLSRVSLTDKIGFRSHAGFFTVCEKYNSNLYFWYFPPFSKVDSAPIILWLQGGPGGSSLFGLFEELGPLKAKKEGFALRRYHWALDYHLIFIDNPVGTGFSFTENSQGYCNNEDCVAQGLFNSLQQFLKLFPKLRHNDMYLTGESYAGKYIPTLAMKIHEENAVRLENEHINLKGLAMGNAYCDPINQLDYGHYLYQHGLLDDNQLKVFLKYQDEISKQIKQQNWEQADVLMDRLMNGQLNAFSYFNLYTGFEYYYNYLHSKYFEDDGVLKSILQNVNVRLSMHAGGLPFNDGEDVQLHLSYDIMKSVAPLVAELLQHYRIIFYNGQLDIIVAYPLTENFLRNLVYPGTKLYKDAVRQVWKVGDDVAGYVKVAGNLTVVLVRNAGHMVPKDQPKWALDMIRRFINNKYWYN